MDQQKSPIGSIGSIYNWEGFWQGYDAPAPFSWELNSDHHLKAEDQELLEGQKYHDWDGNKYLIFDNFHIYPETNLITAYLQPAHPATVKNDLAGTSSGTIEIEDPWFIDFNEPPYGMRNRGLGAVFHSYNSPLNITLQSDRKGVLLDQSGPPDWDPPYYSVRAQQTLTAPVHGQNTDWYFQNWSGTDVRFLHPNQNETAVVFQQSDAVAQANYKGHLVSSNSVATAGNNGRRMVRDENGTLHLVYTDNHQVYYSYSTDGGETWSPEELLPGQGGDDNCFPTAAEMNGVLHITYTSVVESYLDDPRYCYIYYVRKDIDEPDWGYTTHFHEFYSETFTPKSALGLFENESNYYVVVSYDQENGENGSLEIQTYSEILGTSFVPIYGGPIPGQNPSLSATPDQQSLRIAYQKNNQIFLRRWTWPSQWRDELCISDDVWWSDMHECPNITFDGSTTAHVVWKGMNEAVPKPGDSQEVIYYRSIEGLANPSLGEVYMIQDGTHMDHPTVSVDDQYRVSVFYETDGQVIQKNLIGGLWSWSEYGYGRAPNVLSYGTPKASWTTEETLPYIVKAAAPPVGPSGGSKLASNDTIDVYKRLDFSFGNDSTATFLTLDLRDMALNNRPVKLNSSLQSGVFNLLSGSSFQGNLNFYLHNYHNQTRNDLPLLHIYLLNANQNYLLKTVRLKDILNLQGSSQHMIPVHINLPHLPFQQGRLKITFENNSPVITNVVIPQNASNSKTLAVGQSSAHDGSVPVQYALFQNFPNPFNPSTTISFDLPIRGHVLLEIFDIQGRKMRTLANTTYEAGNHEIIWDGFDEMGNQVASGVYVYRVKSGRYVASHKMLLLK